MYPVLNVTDDRTHCGHIGHVVKDFAAGCRLARRFGFRGVNVDLRPGARLDAAEYRGVLSEMDLVPASFGFPADLFRDETHLDGRGAVALSRQLAEAMRPYLDGPARPPGWVALPAVDGMPGAIALEDVDRSRLVIDLDRGRARR